MIYELRVSIPANTAKSAAVDTDLFIHAGTVTQVSIEFPKGCAGLVHAQIFHWERQLWPTNTDSDFASDAAQIVFTEDYKVIDPPFMFTVREWNLDELYAHAPVVRLQITPVQDDPLTRVVNFFSGSRQLLLPRGG